MHGVFITGTDTGVGKTFITAGLASLLLKTGMKVGIMKPVASGAIERDSNLVSEDVEFFYQIFKFRDDYNLINPYCFKAPIAPGVAARAENIIVNLSTIEHNFKLLSKQYDIVIVEGAGGIMSPVTEKYLTNADLAKFLDLPVIIVSRPNLGTINHTMLAIEYAKQIKEIDVQGIILNYQCNTEDDISTKTNANVIKEMSGTKILGIIPYYNYNTQTIGIDNLQDFFANRVDFLLN